MKMRAAVLRTAGLPAPFADSKPFEVTEVDLSGPGPGEVLVRIAAAGICHSDLSAVTGDRGELARCASGAGRTCASPHGRPGRRERSRQAPGA